MAYKDSDYTVVIAIIKYCPILVVEIRTSAFVFPSVAFARAISWTFVVSIALTKAPQRF